MSRRLAINWVALAVLSAGLPALGACSKAHVARSTPTTSVAGTSAAASAATRTMITSPAVNPMADVDPIEEEEGGDDVAALASINPSSGFSGPHAAPGLSGDTLDGRVALGSGTRGTAQTVLSGIAERSDVKVFFSTNSIDRGLLARKVDLGASGHETAEVAVDRLCKTAGLSCFYAADYRSLSVYDPRELQAQGPDMKALVYDRGEGEFEVASAVTSTRAATKPTKPKPAAAGPRKPGKKPVAKPASTRKPAATKPAKPKPAAAKPGKPKPAAAKPAPSRKPPVAKPKPAAATKPPAPAKKPSKG